jgi:dTMP kinase
MHRGIFVSIEGIDNTGKTSICSKLSDKLRKRGFKVVQIVDPPRISPWNSLKPIIIESNDLSNLGRAFLFLAGRVDQYVRITQHALEHHDVVLSDRYIDSWHAYQSVMLAPSLGGIEKAYSFLTKISSLCESKNLLMYPDKTFLIIGSIDTSQSRGLRKKPSVYDKSKLQRNFQRCFLNIAKRNPTRIEVINSRNESVEALCRNIEHKILLSLGLEN